MKYLLFILLFFVYQNNKYIYRSLLWLLGFDIDTKSIENMPSKTIIIGTHTSVHDFLIGIFVYYGYMHNRFDNYILMKKSFEKYTNPFFYLIDKKLKLIKVEKEKSGLINKIIDQIQYKDNYVLYVSPEGTRSYIENIKSGYWTLSKEMNVDVCFFGIDFYKKTIKFEEPRKVEKYWEDEISKFKESASKYAPLFPENCHFFNKKI